MRPVCERCVLLLAWVHPFSARRTVMPHQAVEPAGKLPSTHIIIKRRVSNMVGHWAPISKSPAPGAWHGRPPQQHDTGVTA